MSRITMALLAASKLSYRRFRRYLRLTVANCSRMSLQQTSLGLAEVDSTSG